MILPLSAGGGGKADGLARLIAAGLPVPAGFVVPPGAVDEQELIDAAGRLGTPLVARSSSAVEDGANGAAPGVFLSLVGLLPRDVPAAVAAVRESAAAPAAAAYLARLGRETSPLWVIIQEEIRGAPGTLYTRMPDDPDSTTMLAEIDGTPTLHPRDSDASLIALGRAAEAAIGAPADVELVRDPAGALWLVQARPIRFAVRPPDELLAAARALDPTKVWTWDAVHNPDPLSPAQAGLVALVADLGAHEPAVVAGYLYTTPRPAIAPPIPAAKLRAELDERLVPAWRARLDAARGRGLAAALEAYRDFYASYAGEWSISLAAARAARPHALSRAGARPAAGSFPLAWDVIADLRVVTPPPPRASGEDLAALSEEDDVLFAEAQGLVRDALVEMARAHGLTLDDLCHLPLGDPSGGRERASEARAVRRRQATYAPPVRLLGGRALDVAPGEGVLRGLAASPGRARGVVGEDILVAPTLVPGKYPEAFGARAVVLAHGGILSHGAALARELGIPCVVGCRGAEELVRGEKVLVDGDLGTVVRL